MQNAYLCCMKRNGRQVSRNVGKIESTSKRGSPLVTKLANAARNKSQVSTNKSVHIQASVLF